MTWAHRRQAAYFLGFLFVFFVLVGMPTYLIFQQKPTCFDGKQNQGEDGVDCGGPCVTLCSPLELDPIVVWQQALQVLPGSYTAVAYVQNQNVKAQAINVPYTFTFYDAHNALITTRTGMTYIPPGQSFAVVDTNIIMASDTPVRTFFQFGSPYTWIRVPVNQPQLTIKNQLLSNASTSPTITATLENQNFQTIPETDVAAIVYDSTGNAVAASKTFVKDLPGQSSAPIVFTWPYSFPFTSQVCSVPTDVVLDIDRSGSMAADSTNPPEPFSDVKNAAASFIDNLKEGDQAGVVSFATEPSLDQPLSTDFTTVKSIINGINIHTNGIQYTDITDALTDSVQQISGPSHQQGSKKVIILLTDGVPNLPTKKGNQSYATSSAITEAQYAKSQGIEIFTIGLGHDLDESFLKTIASDPSHYVNADTSKDLGAAYTKVAQAICKTQAFRVELIDTLPPQ